MKPIYVTNCVPALTPAELQALRGLVGDRWLFVSFDNSINHSYLGAPRVVYAQNTVMTERLIQEIATGQASPDFALVLFTNANKSAAGINFAVGLYYWYSGEHSHGGAGDCILAASSAARYLTESRQDRG